MKRLVVIIVLMLQFIVVNAEDVEYFPLVDEGKIWVNCFLDQREALNTTNYNDGYYEFYCLEFKGDTTIEGTAYKKLYRYPLGEQLNTERSYPVAYMCENEKKVRVICNAKHPVYVDDISFGSALYWNDDLMYDFNDITSTNSLLANFIETDPIEVDGTMRKAYCHKNYDWMKIVEGVGIDGKRNFLFYTGSNYTYVNGPARYTMGLSHLLNEDGEVVYRGLWYDCYQTVSSGINTIQERFQEISTDRQYYDLTGRPVTNPSQGIYIKDGKKIIVR